MPSIIFYDPHPHHHHALSVDPDISFLTGPQNLDQAVVNSDHVLPIVCLCCPDPLTIIERLPQDVLIYVCPCRSGYLNLGNDDGRIRENVNFNTDEDWKFQIVLGRKQTFGPNGDQISLTIDRRILTEIVEQSYIASQLSVENQDQNSSSASSVDDNSQSEETE